MTQQEGIPLTADMMAGLTTATREGNQSPLKEFKGRLSEIVGVQLPGTNGGQPYTRLTFKFTELQVIKSVTPYELPQAEVTFPHSEGSGSQYGVMGKSIAALMGGDVPIIATQGKLHHWKWTEGHLGRRPTTDSEGNATGQWHDATFEAFECLSLDGVSAAGVTPPSGAGNGTAVAPAPVASTSVTLQDFIVALVATGPKDEPTLNRACLMDDSIKNNSEQFNVVVSGFPAVMSELVGANRLVKGDDGNYSIPV